MQRQTVLVVAAVAAAVATALWLWPLRPASSPTTAPLPAIAAPPAPTPAQASSAAPAPAAPPPAVESPPAAPIEPAKPAPPPVVAPPAETAVAPPPADDAAPTIPAEGDASGATDGSPDTDAGDAAPAIDEDHAIDLFAERMAALEQGGEDDADRNDATQQKEFDARGDGGEDAQTRTRELRAHLQAWIAALPPDHPHAVLLASVECREGGCRVLAVEGGVDLSGQAETAGHAAVNSLQESFLALRSADWWPQLQLGEASLSMHAADAAAAPGYVLWTIYIGVVGASGDDAAAAVPAG